MNESNIYNSYIIIDDLLNVQEPHESWMELCGCNKKKVKMQNKKFTKIYNLSKYFIPDSPKYYFKTKTINIIEIKQLFNKLNIKFSEKTNLNNIVSSLQSLYPDYTRFNGIDINYNTSKDNKQLFSLLFCYIIINSNNNYKYLQSDSYLMALCRHMIMYTKNKDNTNDNDINIITYILFKTILIKKHYNKFFFADEELWIGQFFFKWSIFFYSFVIRCFNIPCMSRILFSKLTISNSSDNFSSTFSYALLTISERLKIFLTLILL